MRAPGSRARILPAQLFLIVILRLALCLVLATLVFPCSTLAQEPQQAAKTPEPVLRVAFVGDVLLEASWQLPPPPPARMLKGVRELLAEFDLVVANLEEPLTDFPTRTPHKNLRAVEAGRDFIFRATAPDAAQALRSAGIRVAALANNHTMDYTERGLLDTLKRLVDAEIVPVGAGANLREAEQVQVVELRGLRIGFLSFSDVVPRYYWAEGDRPGIASSKEPERVRAAVARARPQADVLAIIFHWGEMFTSEPSERQIELARTAQQAGADLIVGAHPHVLQGVGCLGKVPVVYSAGNFVFATKNQAARRSAIFEVRISSQGADSVRVIPVLLNDEGVPRPAGSSLSQSILGQMKQLSTQQGAQFGNNTATCRQPNGS